MGNKQNLELENKEKNKNKILNLKENELKIIPELNENRWFYLITKSKEINTENIIANLTTDSDMTMGLDVGSNEVLLGCASGDVSATISFRQKYIGV